MSKAAASKETFRSRARELVRARFGSGTWYAYSRRPKGTAAPRIPEGTIRKLLNGATSTPTAITFADEMGVTLDWLLLGREPKTPGATRSEGDLSSDLRTYLVNALGSRATTERRGGKAFFERLLPRGEKLLRDSAGELYDLIVSRWRERAERTHRDLLARLYERLNRARTPRTRDVIARQIVRAGQPWDGALMADEGEIASAPTTRAVGGPWEQHPDPPPIFDAAWLRAQEQALAAGETARRAEVRARKTRERQERRARQRKRSRRPAAVRRGR